MRFVLTIITGCYLAGCGGTGFPDVVDPSEISSSFGSPRIKRIRDVGSPRLPAISGGWKGESDGVAAPGELLLVEGDGFGRQPTLSVGGRATAIVAHTDGGGLLARVPPGVPVGRVEVLVAQPKGRSTMSFPIRRLAVVVHDGTVRFLEVTRDGARLLPAAIELPGARQARLSSDGGAAYVLVSSARGDKIVAIDLGAAGGPRVSTERALTHRAQLLSTAEDAPLLVAIGDGKLTVFTCAHAPTPAPYDATALPKELQQLRAAEVSPDGKLLAGLIADGNRLVVADLEHAPAVRFLSQVDLLPAERLPLVRDLAFSSDGETLWVVSGDNAQSLPAVLPTRLTAVRLLVEGAPPMTVRGERLVSLWRTQTVPGAAAPLHVAVARGQPLASGTTIRMPPEKAAVFVTALNEALYKLGELDLDSPAGAKAALKLWHPPTPGMMVRADINGGGGPLFTTPQIMSALELTPDAQLVMATAARVSAAPSTASLVLDFGVTVAPIWGTPEPVFLPLGKLRSSELKPPFQLGDLRIQP